MPAPIFSGIPGNGARPGHHSDGANRQPRGMMLGMAGTQAGKGGFLGRLFNRARDAALMGSMLDAVEAQSARHGHAVVTDVHLLLHLLEDGEVKNALASVGVDLVRLHADVIRFLEQTAAVYRKSKSARPRPTQHVVMVLEQAELRTVHSRGVPYAVQVLLGLMMQPCPASTFLSDQQVSPVRLMQQLSHGHLGENAGLPPPKLTAPPEERVADVVMLNDEFTSMEFVVHVLETVVGMKPDDAERTMLRVHKDGHASCGTFFLAEAQQRADVLNDYARRHGMPLRCVVAEPA